MNDNNSSYNSLECNSLSNKVRTLQIVDNVYNDMCQFDNLYDCYLEARKLKRYRHEVLYFSNRLEDNLRRIQYELLTQTYNLGPYRRFFVYEPKLRCISALHFKDRIVQWAIYKILNPFYDKMFIEDSYACRKGKGTHVALDRLQYWLRLLEYKMEVNHLKEPYYYLKMDISKFFYRIDHKVLLDILSRRVKDLKLLNLIKIVIDNPKAAFGLGEGVEPSTNLNVWLYDVGMPIGNLTSQLFANLYMNELDQFCKHILRIKYYARYMDDFVILGTKEELQRYRIEIESFIKNHMKLSVNNKTVLAPITKTMEFVGYRVSAHIRKIRKSSIRRIKNRFKSIMRKYEEYKIDLRTLMEPVASWHGMFLRSSDNSLEKKMLSIIRDSKRFQEELIINNTSQRDLNEMMDNYNEDWEYEYDTDIENDKWFDYYQDYIEDY